MLSDKQIDAAAGALNKCGLVFMPSDTIYGLSAKTECVESIEKIYEIKGRDKSKPLIVLVGSLEQLAGLGVAEPITPLHEKAWAEQPTTIVLECDNDKKYLTRGSGSLGIRLISEPSLAVLLNRVGPVISTSANLSDQPPITSVEEARTQFGDQIDYYLDVGVLTGQPSRVIKINDGKIETLRP